VSTQAMSILNPWRADEHLLFSIFKITLKLLTIWKNVQHEKVAHFS
jgi:hypothetical protein